MLTSVLKSIFSRIESQESEFGDWWIESFQKTFNLIWIRIFLSTDAENGLSVYLFENEVELEAFVNLYLETGVAISSDDHFFVSFRVKNQGNFMHILENARCVKFVLYISETANFDPSTVEYYGFPAE